MASPTYDSVSSIQSTTTTVSYTHSPVTSADAIVVMIMNTGAARAPNAASGGVVKYGGVNLTQHSGGGGIVGTPYNSGACMWYLDDVSGRTGDTVYVDPGTYGYADFCYIYSVLIYGSGQGVAVDEQKQMASTNSTADVTFTAAVSSGDATYVVGWAASSGATPVTYTFLPYGTGGTSVGAYPGGSTQRAIGVGYVPNVGNGDTTGMYNGFYGWDFMDAIGFININMDVQPPPALLPVTSPTATIGMGDLDAKPDSNLLPITSPAGSIAVTVPRQIPLVGTVPTPGRVASPSGLTTPMLSHDGSAPVFVEAPTGSDPSMPVFKYKNFK